MHSELLTPTRGRHEGHPTAADNGQDTVRPRRRARASCRRRALRLRGARADAAGRRGDRRPASAARARARLRKRREGAAVRVRRRPVRPRRRRRAPLPRDVERARRDALVRGRRHRARPRPGARATPAATLRAKYRARTKLHSRSRVDLPGDRSLQNAVDYGKQNLADLTQTARTWRSASSTSGKSYPRPVGSSSRVTFIGAGYPDYPWLFATDGEYTAFAAVALGQFEPIKDHLVALREVSDLLNAKSGKVAHEIVTDGSVYFGANTDQGNTDESVKFPSAVALVWRWSGDNRFLNRPLRLLRRATALRRRQPRRRQGRLARGPRQRRARGHGRGEARQRRLPDPRAQRPRRHGRVQARHGRPSAGPTASPTSCAPRSTRPGGTPRRASTPTRSVTTTPSSSSSTGSASRRWRPGSRRARPRTAEHGCALASARPTASAARCPFNRGLFHTGCDRRPGGQGREDRVQAQHRDQGRRRRQLRPPRQQRRYTTPTPPACSTSSPARCPRSCRHPIRTATSTAAGPAARCSCRPGATTAPPGR